MRRPNSIFTIESRRCSQKTIDLKYSVWKKNYKNKNSNNNEIIWNEEQLQLRTTYRGMNNMAIIETQKTQVIPEK